jgi:arylsulfatase A-like enzyme
MSGRFFLLCFALLSATSSFAAARPNILLFLVDDMGWQDTSVPFYETNGVPFETILNRRYRTPNMERLAARGTVFTAAYAQAICSPSRVSLLTGMNSARHHVTTWTLFRDKTTDASNPFLLAPQDWAVNGVQPAGTLPEGSSRHPLTEEPFSYKMGKPYVTATALPELLRESGYVTIHCGKAHFGAKDTPGANPKSFGFDYNIAGSEIGGVGSYRGKDHYGQPPWRVRGLDENEYYTHDIFLTEALTREAVKRLDALKADGTLSHKPFYLYMAHHAIHAPWKGDNFDARFTNNYAAVSGSVYSTTNGFGWSINERNYATLIEGMDKSLGDLSDWLERNGLATNTVILFMSDNGGLAISGRMAGLDSNRHANWPLSFGKGSGREGGIREPMIACWPGVTRPGTRCRAPVIIEDFFETILDIAGAKAPATVQQRDGQSFASLLRDPAAARPDRPLLFHCPNVWAEGSESDPHYGPYTALRLGRWKLLYLYASREFELYGIESDVSESRDLSAADPARVKAMAAEMTRLLRERHAQLPLSRATGRPVPYPGEQS